MMQTTAEKIDNDCLERAAVIFERLDLLEAANYLRDGEFDENGSAIQLLLMYCQYLGQGGSDDETVSDD